MNRLIDSRWDNAPFGTKPHATRDEYLALFETAKSKSYEEADAFEQLHGYAIDRGWLNDLALHTQIVKKKSDLCYPHGRLLYTLLRKTIEQQAPAFTTVLETGTARGFSALCMAKAMEDAGVQGRVVSVDVLSHVKKQIWNCIDDHDGPKSRAEILEPWSDLLRRVFFIQGDTRYTLPRLGLDRIHFAFLDAQHTEASVLHEFNFVSGVQTAGDVIFFDDVTPEAFPGVVKAVKHIENLGTYRVHYLAASEQRGYAFAERVCHSLSGSG